MALPKSKYSDPLHTPGKEFYLNGKEYVGWYVKTYQDEYFTGKLLDLNSKKLEPIKTEIKKTEPFAEEVVEPTSFDRSKGVFNRYFLQKKSNLKIIEVSKSRYDKLKKDKSYSSSILNWKIKGPADNQSINGYTYFGAAHVNQINTEALENNIKGISKFIKDYSQFVE